MDLNTWSRNDFHVSARMQILLGLGGHPYRCEYCRVNFVSFRTRREKFTFRRWKNRASQRETAVAS